MSQLLSFNKSPLSYNTQSTLVRQTLSATQDRFFQMPKMKCRICLQQCNTNLLLNQTFIKPCKCKGTGQFVHNQCMKEWINKMIKDKQQQGIDLTRINCQICQEIIEFKSQKTIKCLTQEERKRKIYVFWPLLMILTILMLICTGTLVWVIFYQITATGLTNKEKQTLVGISISVYVTMPISVALCLYRLIDRFLIKKQKKVLQINSKPFKIQLKSRISQGFNNSINPETESELIKRRVRLVLNQSQRYKNLSGQHLGNQENISAGVSLTPQSYFF